MNDVNTTDHGMRADDGVTGGDGDSAEILRVG